MLYIQLMHSYLISILIRLMHITSRLVGDGVKGEVRGGEEGKLLGSVIIFRLASGHHVQPSKAMIAHGGEYLAGEYKQGS